MNAKEKAMELVHKYWGKGITNNKETAKKCTLIAVDEIINHHSQGQGLYRIDTYYWQQVKSELQSL